MWCLLVFMCLCKYLTSQTANNTWLSDLCWFQITNHILLLGGCCITYNITPDNPTMFWGINQEKKIRLYMTDLVVDITEIKLFLPLKTKCVRTNAWMLQHKTLTCTLLHPLVKKIKQFDVRGGVREVGGGRSHTILRVGCNWQKTSFVHINKVDFDSIKQVSPKWTTS